MIHASEKHILSNQTMIHASETQHPITCFDDCNDNDDYGSSSSTPHRTNNTDTINVNHRRHRSNMATTTPSSHNNNNNNVDMMIHDNHSTILCCGVNYSRSIRSSFVVIHMITIPPMDQNHNDNRKTNMKSPSIRMNNTTATKTIMHRSRNHKQQHRMTKNIHNEMQQDKMCLALLHNTSRDDDDDDNDDDDNSQCSSVQQQDDDRYCDRMEPIVVRIQFPQEQQQDDDELQLNNNTYEINHSLRSYCRRFCKIGDLLTIRIRNNHNDNDYNNKKKRNNASFDRPPYEWHGIAASSDITNNSDSRSNTDVTNTKQEESVSRNTQEQQQQSSHTTTTTTTIHNNKSYLIVHLHSIEQAMDILYIPQHYKQYWNMKQCQKYQNQYLLCNNNQDDLYDYDTDSMKKNKQQSIQINNKKKPNINHPSNESNDSIINNNHPRGSNYEKRIQGQYMANFMIHMIAHKIEQQHNNKSPKSSSNNVTTGSTNEPSVLGDPTTWALYDMSNSFSQMNENMITTNKNDNKTQSEEINRRMQRQDLLLQAIDLLNNIQSVDEQVLRDSKMATTTNSVTSCSTSTPTKAIVADGVLDVAGGCGHVSMALGLLGIQSTVIDPLENVGKLPNRDHKVWNRSMKKMWNEEQCNKNNDNNYDNVYCQPVTTMIKPRKIRQYQTLRAWFGIPPNDNDFRTPDCHRNDIPIIVASSNDTTEKEQQQSNLIILQNISSKITAIVALHPDEATDSIVDIAVELMIPFCIVPCCVFGRLFPHRRKGILSQQQQHQINSSLFLSIENNNNNNELQSNKISNDSNGIMVNNNTTNDAVSSYTDLLDYLQAKHPSIQRTNLPFKGSNVILWSTY